MMFLRENVGRSVVLKGAFREQPWSMQTEECDSIDSLRRMREPMMDCEKRVW